MRMTDDQPGGNSATGSHTNENRTACYQSTRLPNPIWEGVRAQVIRAYDGRCYGCGGTISDAQEASRPRGPGLWVTSSPEADWHAHHRLPVAMGGGGARNADEFLLLCNVCHDIESAKQDRSLALRNVLFRIHRILRTLQAGRFSRPLLRQSTDIAKNSFNQAVRWLYRTGCIAGDAKSIGLTRQGESALRQLEIHCRLTPQEECFGRRPINWFADGAWHPWLRVHLAILITAECRLLPPVSGAIPLIGNETTCDPEGSLRFAARLIERMAEIGDGGKLVSPLDVALLPRLHGDLYAIEAWCIEEIRSPERSWAITR